LLFKKSLFAVTAFFVPIVPIVCAPTSPKSNTKVENFLKNAEHELNVLRNPEAKNVCYLGTPQRLMQSKEDIVKRQVAAELQAHPEQPIHVVKELVKFFK